MESFSVNTVVAILLSPAPPVLLQLQATHDPQLRALPNHFRHQAGFLVFQFFHQRHNLFGHKLFRSLPDQLLIVGEVRWGEHVLRRRRLQQENYLPLRRVCSRSRWPLLFSFDSAAGNGGPRYSGYHLRPRDRPQQFRPRGRFNEPLSVYALFVLLLSWMAAKKAIDQKSQDQQGHKNVGPIPFVQEHEERNATRATGVAIKTSSPAELTLVR